MESSTRARAVSTVDRASVESILGGNHSTASRLPAPIEHIGSPKAHRSAQDADDEPPMSPLILSKPPSKSRPNSFISSSQKNKANRLSLSFPIQLPANYQTNSSLGANDLMSETVSGTQSTTSSNAAAADPPNDFLQELARQERRVLELKEELGKAEGELASLKKKWALREVHKKRSEIRAVEQMAPYSPKQASTNTGTGEQRDGLEIPRRSAEMTPDRRKAMLLAGIVRGETRGKVFKGRHARTLSLLSPDRLNFTTNSLGSFSPLNHSGSASDNNIEPGPGSPETTTGNGCVPLSSIGISRSATLPDLPTNLFKPRNRHSYNHPPGDCNISGNIGSANDVLKTGKKLAEDFKAGLWTFVEDLRQATVGEEAITGNGTFHRTNTRSSAVGLGISSLMNMGVGGPLTPSPKINNREEGIDDQGNGSPKKHSPIPNRDYTRDLHEVIPADEEGLLGPSSSASTSTSTRPSTEKPPHHEQQTQTQRKSITAPQQEDLTADDWLNWDSPQSTTSSRTNSSKHSDDNFLAGGDQDGNTQRWSSSTLATVLSSNNEVEDSTPSSKFSTRYFNRLGVKDGDGGAIQWPQLKQSFSPSNLKRTAESLMREWERSLTWPPEEEEDGGSNSRRVGSFEGHDLLM